MLRSMYSGISGLRNFQTKLDVIGNNIANVNTFGFKKGRTVFSDTISQAMAGASAGNANRGGVNGRQIGLGSQIATIDTLHSGGSTQFTGNTLDLAIGGDGFFVVADSIAPPTTPPATPTAFSKELYTRAGNFYMDKTGFLVTGDGKYLVGNTGLPPAAATRVPIQIPTNAQSMSVGQDGTVTYVDAAGVLQTAGQLEMAKFPNPGGLEKVGGNYFAQSANSGAVLSGAATTNGLGKINSGYLEMSNVDLAEEFTEMIVAQRGFQANTRIITTSDEILQELVNLKR